MKISKIKPNPDNPRKIKATALDKLKESIERDPAFMRLRPIVVDGDGVILGGNQRYAAIKSLGMNTIPDEWVVMADDLTDEQRRRFIIVDNGPEGMAGEWDLDLLARDWADVDLSGLGLDIPVADVPYDGQADPDEIPEPIDDPVSKKGDVWVLGDHRLMCGDSTKDADVAALLRGDAPLLMVTDPPYGVEYDATWRGRAGHATMGKNRTGRVVADDRSDWRDVWVLFPGDVAYVWHGGLHAATVAASLVDSGFDLRSQIIWNKSVMVMGRGYYHWKHEPCWYAVKKGRPGRWLSGRDQTTVWDLASPIHIMSGSKEEKTAHPTQKPLECMARPIRNHDSEMVYEPFSGSGTTIIACEQLGRKCRAMEIEPRYVDVAVRRWEKFTGKTAVLERHKEEVQ